MGYFPFFVELSGLQGLVAGGGETALHKIQKLLPYGPQLTVAAPAIRSEIRAIPGLQLYCEPFSPRFLTGKSFVVAATSSRRINHQISALCRERRIPVNVVDDPLACTFLFPALIQRGSFSVGISTGGASPSAAVYLRERAEELLPEHLEEILSYLEMQRSLVKAELPEGPGRARCLAQMAAACMKRDRGLTEPEREVLLLPFRMEGRRELP